MLMSSMPKRTSPRSDFLPGTLEMLILRTLDLQPMHGYGIARHIHDLSREVLTVEEGSLYPALQRMLVKGWVTAAWRTSETNRRTRVYTLTAAGRRQLDVAQDNFKTMFAALARVMNG